MVNNKSVDQWFDEYASSHQHPINKAIHWVCVPGIFLVMVGLIWALPVPALMTAISPWLNWATLMAIPVIIFYWLLSARLAVGLTLFTVVCLELVGWYEALQWMPLWATALILFVFLWIGQFIGHHIEGKKPSFFKDVQFLLIGPAWLMGFVYQRLGLTY